MIAATDAANAQAAATAAAAAQAAAELASANSFQAALTSIQAAVTTANQTYIADEQITDQENNKVNADENVVNADTMAVNLANDVEADLWTAAGVAEVIASTADLITSATGVKQVPRAGIVADVYLAGLSLLASLLNLGSAAAAVIANEDTNDLNNASDAVDHRCKY